MGSKANPYPLGRGLHASTRLYLQHWMWRREMGYLLHPVIPTDSNTDLKIADVACGTGIWLVDLAKQLPHATLDGYDVSAAQFPHRNWLPANVTLQQRDALKEVPDELVGKYDIVHIGLVVLVVRAGDPGPLLDNLARMLKPGGYIQWNEADIEHLPRIPASPEISTTNCDAFYTKIYEVVEKLGLALDPTWVRKLGQTFDARPDLHFLVSQRYPVPDDLAQPASQQHLMSLGEMVERLDDGMVQELNLWELYEGAVAEMQAGVSVRMGQVVVVGRKAAPPAAAAAAAAVVSANGAQNDAAATC